MPVVSDAAANKDRDEIARSLTARIRLKHPLVHGRTFAMVDSLRSQTLLAMVFSDAHLDFVVGQAAAVIAKEDSNKRDAKIKAAKDHSADLGLIARLQKRLKSTRAEYSIAALQCISHISPSPSAAADKEAVEGAVAPPPKALARTIKDAERSIAVSAKPLPKANKASAKQHEAVINQANNASFRQASVSLPNIDLQIQISTMRAEAAVNTLTARTVCTDSKIQQKMSFMLPLRDSKGELYEKEDFIGHEDTELFNQLSLIASVHSMLTNAELRTAVNTIAASLDVISQVEEYRRTNNLAMPFDRCHHTPVCVDFQFNNCRGSSSGKCQFAHRCGFCGELHAGCADVQSGGFIPLNMAKRPCDAHSKHSFAGCPNLYAATAAGRSVEHRFTAGRAFEEQIAASAAPNCIISGGNSIMHAIEQAVKAKRDSGKPNSLIPPLIDETVFSNVDKVRISDLLEARACSKAIELSSAQEFGESVSDIRQQALSRSESASTQLARSWEIEQSKRKHEQNAAAASASTAKRQRQSKQLLAIRNTISEYQDERAPMSSAKKLRALLLTKAKRASPPPAAAAVTMRSSVQLATPISRPNAYAVAAGVAGVSAEAPRREEGPSRTPSFSKIKGQLRATGGMPREQRSQANSLLDRMRKKLKTEPGQSLQPPIQQASFAASVATQASSAASAISQASQAASATTQASSAASAVSQASFAASAATINSERDFMLRSIEAVTKLESNANFSRNPTAGTETHPAPATLSARSRAALAKCRRAALSTLNLQARLLTIRAVKTSDPLVMDTFAPSLSPEDFVWLWFAAAEHSGYVSFIHWRRVARFMDVTLDLGIDLASAPTHIRRAINSTPTTLSKLSKHESLQKPSWFHLVELIQELDDAFNTLQRSAAKDAEDQGKSASEAKYQQQSIWLPLCPGPAEHHMHSPPPSDCVYYRYPETMHGFLSSWFHAPQTVPAKLRIAGNKPIAWDTPVPEQRTDTEEQAFQYLQALVRDDQSAADYILDAGPNRVGRKARIKALNDTHSEAWNSLKVSALIEALTAKFEDNRTLRLRLFHLADTNHCFIQTAAESFWSAGITSMQAAARQEAEQANNGTLQTTIRGANVHGKCLHYVVIMLMRAFPEDLQHTRDYPPAVSSSTQYVVPAASTAAKGPMHSGTDPLPSLSKNGTRFSTKTAPSSNSVPNAKSARVQQGRSPLQVPVHGALVKRAHALGLSSNHELAQRMLQPARDSLRKHQTLDLPQGTNALATLAPAWSASARRTAAVSAQQQHAEALAAQQPSAKPPPCSLCASKHYCPEHEAAGPSKLNPAIKLQQAAHRLEWQRMKNYVASSALQLCGRSTSPAPTKSAASEQPIDSQDCSGQHKDSPSKPNPQPFQLPEASVLQSRPRASPEHSPELTPLELSQHKAARRRSNATPQHSTALPVASTIKEEQASVEVQVSPDTANAQRALVSSLQEAGQDSPAAPEQRAKVAPLSPEQVAERTRLQKECIADLCKQEQKVALSYNRPCPILSALRPATTENQQKLINATCKKCGHIQMFARDEELLLIYNSLYSKPMQECECPDLDLSKSDPPSEEEQPAAAQQAARPSSGHKPKPNISKPSVSTATVSAFELYVVETRKAAESDLSNLGCRISPKSLEKSWARVSEPEKQRYARRAKACKPAASPARSPCASEAASVAKTVPLPTLLNLPQASRKYYKHLEEELQSLPSYKKVTAIPQYSSNDYSALDKSQGANCLFKGTKGFFRHARLYMSTSFQNAWPILSKHLIEIAQDRFALILFPGCKVLSWVHVSRLSAFDSDKVGEPHNVPKQDLIHAELACKPSDTCSSCAAPSQTIVQPKTADGGQAAGEALLENLVGKDVLNSLGGNLVFNMSPESTLAAVELAGIVDVACAKSVQILADSDAANAAYAASQTAAEQVKPPVNTLLQRAKADVAKVNSISKDAMRTANLLAKAPKSDQLSAIAKEVASQKQDAQPKQAWFGTGKKQHDLNRSGKGVGLSSPSSSDSSPTEQPASKPLLRRQSAKNVAAAAAFTAKAATSVAAATPPAPTATMPSTEDQQQQGPLQLSSPNKISNKQIRELAKCNKLYLAEDGYYRPCLIHDELAQTFSKDLLPHEAVISFPSFFGRSYPSLFVETDGKVASLYRTAIASIVARDERENTPHGKNSPTKVVSRPDHDEQRVLRAKKAPLVRIKGDTTATAEKRRRSFELMAVTTTGIWKMCTQNVKSSRAGTLPVVEPGHMLVRWGNHRIASVPVSSVADLQEDCLGQPFSTFGESLPSPVTASQLSQGGCANTRASRAPQTSSRKRHSRRTLSWQRKKRRKNKSQRRRNPSRRRSLPELELRGWQIISNSSPRITSQNGAISTVT